MNTVKDFTQQLQIDTLVQTQAKGWKGQPIVV